MEAESSDVPSTAEQNTALDLDIVAALSRECCGARRVSLPCLGVSCLAAVCHAWGCLSSVPCLGVPQSGEFYKPEGVVRGVLQA